ncbi:hypothetical protein LguiA_007203 [Lonicera macranthoides]
MVKGVVGEETQLKLAEDRLSQSSLPSQVGLVIGKLSSSLDRGFVFDLIPTPFNDDGEPACSIIESSVISRDDNSKKKGSSSKPKSSQSRVSSLSIDKDWVAEHARQVSRMLLGGMKVVGIYIWVNESSFKNSTMILCQIVKGVAEAAPLTDCDERLLIHISYSPRRWTCRNCTLDSNITSGSLHPCDFKMGRVFTSLQKFRCTYNFDVRLPVFRGNGSNMRRVADILRCEILSQAKELKGAKALIDGKLVIMDEQCVLDGLHEVEFLLPFMQDTSVEVCSQKEVVVGVLSFSGSVCSFAYLNSKEPISQALADLKGDIITSLQSRLDIICDEADRDSDMTADVDGESGHQISTKTPVSQLDLQLLRKQCSLSFPRRVFVPWLEGTYICDYIQPSETLEVVKDHCVELMSMEVPSTTDADADTSKILELETEAATLTTTNKSFWENTTTNTTATTSRGVDNDRRVSTNKKSTGFNAMAAVLVLLFAVLVGMLLLHLKRRAS